jgi:hypothetical protein
MSYLDDLDEEKRKLKCTYEFKLTRKNTEFSAIAQWLEDNFEPGEFEIRGYFETNGADIIITITDGDNAAKFKLFWTE